MWFESLSLRCNDTTSLANDLKDDKKVKKPGENEKVEQKELLQEHKDEGEKEVEIYNL